MTLLSRIKSSFDENANSIAIIFEGREYSYKTIGKLVAHRITEIQNYSLKSGDIVSIENNDPLEYWISCLSSLFMGLVITPFKSNDGLPDKFSDRKTISHAVDADIKVSSYKEINLDDVPDNFDIPLFLNEDISVIFFTSGTTGRKKSIGLTNDTIYSRVQTSQRFFPDNRVSFTFMPPFSTAAFHFQLRQWLAGGLVILDKEFINVTHELSRNLVDYIVGSPHQYVSFIDDLFQNQIAKQFKVQSIVVCGGELTKTLKQKLTQVFPKAEIYSAFGTSETGWSALNNLTLSDDLSNLGDFSLGGDCDVEIDNDESGYLKLKNSHMANGYLNTFAEEFKDGWFYPGDRAIKKGNQIYLLGRDDSVVNVGGIKISPQEIDDFVCSLDGVKDAACFWIKDKYSYNELWVAVVIQESIDVKAILRELYLKFGVVQGPKRVIPVQMIPRTYSGKPQRNLMSEKVTEQINLLK